MKIDPLEVLIWCLTAVMLVAVSLAVGHCECLASIDDCIAATVRVHVPGAVGTGVVIVNNPAIYVLTNAHVVGGATKAEVDFWWEANESKRISGDIIWTKYNDTTDMAVIRIDRGVFGGRVPPAIPFAPANYVLPKGQPVYLIGCAHGAWPSAIKGMHQGYSQDTPTMLLKPPVESGRSGSGVFDARGNYLLGLIHQTTSTRGRAQYVNLLHARLLPREVAQQTRLFDGGFCDRLKGGSQQQTPSPGTGGAYPDLPPLPGYSQQPMVDEAAREEIMELSGELADLKADLADKEDRLQRLFGEDYQLMRDIAADAKSAKETADEANEDVSAVSETVGVVAKAVAEIPKTIDSKIAEIPEVDVEQEVENKFGIVRDSYAKLQLRIEEAQAEGAEGTREIARTVVWGIAKTYAWPIGGALGLALFLLWRRIEAKKAAGEPLLYERAAGRARDVVGRLRDRIGTMIEVEEEESLLGRVAERLRPQPPPVPPTGT